MRDSRRPLLDPEDPGKANNFQACTNLTCPVLAFGHVSFLLDYRRTERSGEIVGFSRIPAYRRQVEGPGGGLR